MCGILGEIGGSSSVDQFSQRQYLLRHRGPDGSGLFISPNGQVKLGHHRLSVIDLSERATQPMTLDGCTLVYNGEVYNYRDLQAEIGGTFHSSSDTEVILRGYLKWGVAVFKKLDGMFALAIYDSRSEELILARDRMGVKPLYYRVENGCLEFASELKAFGGLSQVNLLAVHKFLAQGYIYGDETIYQGIKKIPPACYARFDTVGGNLTLHCFWRPVYASEISDAKSALVQLDLILRNTLKLSLVSDVPLGLALSSGVDSALLACYAAQTLKRLDTFTVGFERVSYDESAGAKRVASFLGTTHHEIRLSEAEIIDKIPGILDAFDEPFSDAAAIPTFFLSQFMKQRVTVALTGDGADELFGGYPLYYLPPFAKFYQRLPARWLLRRLVMKLPVSERKFSFEFKAKRFIQGAEHAPLRAHFAYQALRLSEVVIDQSVSSVFAEFQRHSSESGAGEMLNELLYVDQRTILEGKYLVKSDRMSMVHGLEMRLPFLTNQLIDWSNRLDPKLKVSGITTKVILRRLAAKHLPPELVSGPKKGFTVPMAHWLRTSLKEFMMDVLDQGGVEKLFFLDQTKVARMVQDHLEGRRDYHRELWALISLVRFFNRHQA